MALMQNVNIKNQNDSTKFKIEFKKRLYNFVLSLIKFIDSWPKNSINKVITDQLLRSGTSILANYIEATSASSKKDFVRFFTYSLKSANESKVWLTLIRDLHNRDNIPTNKLLNELIEISKVLAASILTMKRKHRF